MAIIKCIRLGKRRKKEKEGNNAEKEKYCSV